MTPPEALSPDLLLEHAAFVRGLARSLVVDEHRAEDVAQETFLAVLRRPPPAGARVRAWLGVVTRNLALRARRGEGRARRRLGSLEPRDPAPSTGDVVARLEAQRRIADAVARLEEPGRSAIVMRYFDGLKPAGIARRLGLPVRTVESRLRRAREVLRARLDAAYGGRRGAWCLVLAPSLGVPLDWVAGSSSAAAAGSAAGTTTASASAALGGTATGAVITGVALMSTKMIVGIAAACVAGAFVAGWQLEPPGRPAPLTADRPTEEVAGRGAELGSEGTMLANTQRELGAARARADELEQEVAALKQEVAALREAPRAPAGGTAAGATAPAEGGTRYLFKRFEETLKAADWAKAGEALSHMAPLLLDLKGAIVDGKPMPANVGDIQRWNGELINVALGLQKGDIPGTGTNGTFTHPSVSVNFIHATLLAAGVPLDEAQARRLGELGDRYVAEDERRLAGYGEDAFQLQKTLEECELKDRFFTAADGLLTEAQRNVLHPPEIRGRLGVDLFSSGVVLHALTKPVRFTNRTDLATACVNVIVGLGGVDESTRPFLDEAVAAWARGLPDAFLAACDDPVVRASGALSGGLVAGWARIDTAKEAARYQLVMQRELADRLPPDSELGPKLRESPLLLLPVKKAE